MQEIKNGDRRIERTKRNIREAFTSLLMEKDLSNITVKEISERADINRKTFYMYFSNIDDIVDDMEKNLVDKFIKVINGFTFSDPSFDPYAFFESLNSVISENIELYRRLNAIGMLPGLISHVKDIMIDIFMQQYNLNYSDNSERYTLYAEYAASGILSMYAKWFSMNSDITLEELTKTAGELTIYGFKSLLNNIKDNKNMLSEN